MTDAEYKTIAAKFNQLQQLELNKKRITKRIEAESLIPSIIKQPIIDIILAEYININMYLQPFGTQKLKK